MRQLAADADVTIVVEPLNELDVPGSLVPTPRSALALVEDVGAPNVRLLYDAYHAACAGCDPVHEVADFVPLIGHVQFADCPGRGAPGQRRPRPRRLRRRAGGGRLHGRGGLEFFADGPTPTRSGSSR